MLTAILTAVGFFAIIGVIVGVLLAIAAHIFAVKQDPRVAEVLACLPGANCGGCGYAGCAAVAEGIVKGELKVSTCPVGGAAAAQKIGAIMGVEAGPTVRMRAQVMCSGSRGIAQKKYAYDGARDCVAASRLGGGDKLCPNGCIGLGTCAEICPFDAIEVKNGVAAVDYRKCRGCGLCTEACPKHIIKLVPFDAAYWVGCSSVDKGAQTRKYCDAGCISCKMCEKACEHGAIHVNDFVASIDYEKCVGCGKCEAACPRKIIWSAEKQRRMGVALSEGDIPEEEKEKR